MARASKEGCLGGWRFPHLGYVLSFLTGLRAGELGRIELDDIEEVDGIYCLQLRGFNPSKGRVARKNVKRFKTQASHRTIPLRRCFSISGCWTAGEVSLQSQSLG